MVGQRVRTRELAPARPVGADEIGVAEITLRHRPVLLAPRPQVAAGKAQEDRAAARLHALALERQESLLDRVGHAYAVGSVSPASAKPLARRMQASQRPQWRPSGAGS